MKNLLTIVFIGCFILFADSFYSQSGAECVEEFIYDCFDPSKYHQPTLIPEPTVAYYPCKTWTSGTANCPGTYYMAVYVDPPGLKDIVSSVISESTVPGNVNIEIMNGAQIENILRTFPAAQLEQLAVNEIREGKIPVFIRFTCYENGQGNVTFKLICAQDTSKNLHEFDPCSIHLLLFPDKDN